MNRSSSVLLACLLSLAILVFGHSENAKAQSRPAPNMYQVSLEISRGKAEPAKSEFGVAFGIPAQIVASNKGKAEGNYRIQAIVTPASPASGKKTAKIDLVILEQISDAWVVMAEPSLVAFDGEDASFSSTGSTGEFEISIKATSIYDLRAVNFKPQSCPVLNSSTPAMSKGSETSAPIYPMAPKRCCTMTCAGGGQTFTCCNVTYCCNCNGTCCSPPPAEV